jgi:broad specificity phosphatase PhoE
VRAQQTADPLCAIKKISMNLQPLLRERSFGDLRGKAYDEIDADFFDNSYAPPNGETQQQFAQRVELAWQAVLTSYQHTEHSLIVMTHGLVLRQLIKQHLVVNRDVLPLSDFQNTCIIQVQAKDKKTVLRLCDVQHLDENSTIGTAI